jgi:ribonuclease J
MKLFKKTTSAPQNLGGLKFIALSGTTGVTENCYLYEHANDMIMVDCGVGFPEPEMFGVDLVIPDFSYVRQNPKKLKAIVISHGHEDHIGALPYLLRDLSAQGVKVPVYCTKLVAGFIEDKFKDFREGPPKFHIFDPEKDSMTIGVFKVTPFRVSHSIPDACGFCIDTPEGKLFHVPDYKFDWTPVDGRPFDVQKAAILASGGVLAVASDCLGSNSPGHTESEKTIEDRLQPIFEKAKGAIYFTTISSNISRMQQAINVSKKLNRQICFVGRSIDRKAEIARRLGFLHYPPQMLVTSRQARKMPPEKVTYIISGSYGQPGSALYRVIVGEHKELSLEKNDVVVFSADPAPPGSKGNVDFLVDRIIEMGIEVHYYDIQEDLHVSGHGSIEDIKMLLGITKPQFTIPIGGTVRHMRAYKNICIDMNIPDKNVIELGAGEIVEFTKDRAIKNGKINVKPTLVDGLGIGDVGNVVLRDRQVLSQDGIAIVLLQVSLTDGKVLSEPDIISRGFVFEAQKKDLLRRAGRDLKVFLDRKIKMDKHLARDEAIMFLEKYFFDQTGRRPMILPVIVEV